MTATLASSPGGVPKLGPALPQRLSRNVCSHSARSAAGDRDCPSPAYACEDAQAGEPGAARHNLADARTRPRARAHTRPAEAVRARQGAHAEGGADLGRVAPPAVPHHPGRARARAARALSDGDVCAKADGVLSGVRSGSRRRWTAVTAETVQGGGGRRPGPVGNEGMLLLYPDDGPDEVRIGDDAPLPVALVLQTLANYGDGLGFARRARAYK